MTDPIENLLAKLPVDVVDAARVKAADRAAAEKAAHEMWLADRKARQDAGKKQIEKLIAALKLKVLGYGSYGPIYALTHEQLADALRQWGDTRWREGADDALRHSAWWHGQVSRAVT